MPAPTLSADTDSFLRDVRGRLDRIVLDVNGNLLLDRIDPDARPRLVEALKNAGADFFGVLGVVERRG